MSDVGQVIELPYRQPVITRLCRMLRGFVGCSRAGGGARLYRVLSEKDELRPMPHALTGLGDNLAPATEITTIAVGFEDRGCANLLRIAWAEPPVAFLVVVPDGGGRGVGIVGQHAFYVDGRYPGPVRCLARSQEETELTVALRRLRAAAGRPSPAPPGGLLLLTRGVGAVSPRTSRLLPPSTGFPPECG